MAVEVCTLQLLLSEGLLGLLRTVKSNHLARLPQWKLLGEQLVAGMFGRNGAPLSSPTRLELYVRVKHRSR